MTSSVHRRPTAAAALVLAALAAGCSTTAPADTPQTPPAEGYTLHDERAVDRFTVQRWVSGEMPDVSPAGYCDCITVIYEGSQLVLDLGASPGITEVEALADVTGDSRAEVVVRSYSGGAHCCEATSVYSVEDASPRTLLSVDTGNCPGEFADLDGDGVQEFRTCDDRFAYEFCAFAFSPMPPVVFAYDRGSGRYRPHTPAFAHVLRYTSAEDARREMVEYHDDPALQRCAALRPALDLVYAGRADEGWAVFRNLYKAPDAASIEAQAKAMLAESGLPVAR
jgi:hypothetical protein